MTPVLAYANGQETGNGQESGKRDRWENFGKFFSFEDVWSSNIWNGNDDVAVNHQLYVNVSLEG